VVVVGCLVMAGGIDDSAPYTNDDGDECEISTVIYRLRLISSLVDFGWI
jgi:hypothetical protein